MRSMKHLGALVVSSVTVLLLLTACENSSSPTEPPTLPPDTELQTIYSAKNSGIHTRGGEIILTEERWQEVWAAIQAGSETPGAPAPSINFSTDMLIFAAMGDEPDSCWNLTITEVRPEVAKIRVDVSETRPPLNCACPAVVIQPVHVVRVSREELPGEFNYRRTITGPGCN